MRAKSGFKKRTVVYTLIGFNLFIIAPASGQVITDRCSTAMSTLSTAEIRLADACKKTGSADCAVKAMDCDDTIKGESFDTMGMIFEALGLPKNATAAQQQNACPQLFGKDWYDEKKRLQDALKDAQKDIAELNDEKAEVQDEYNKTTNDLQEQLTKAQEEYKETEESLNEDQRKMLADFNNSQNQAAENMRSLGNKLLELEAKITETQRAKAQRLLILTNSAAKMGCMNKIAQEKEQYEKLYGVKGNNTGNYVQQANNKRKALNESFQACMENVNQERIKLNETTKSTVEMLQKQIRDTQSSLDEVQNSLNLAKSQLEEMKASIATKKSNALQSVIDLGTRVQNQLQAAYQKLQTNLQTIAAKNTSLTQEINRINSEIAALGVAPKGGRSNTNTPDEISADIASATRMVEAAREDKNNFCGNGSSSGTGSGGSSTTR